MQPCNKMATLRRSWNVKAQLLVESLCFVFINGQSAACHFPIVFQVVNHRFAEKSPWTCCMEISAISFQWNYFRNCLSDAVNDMT
jgi:hypothetical protein